MQTQQVDYFQDLQYYLNCPLTQKPIKDPFVTTDGHTYQKQSIIAWLDKQQTSPKTGLPLNTKLIIPNIVMKELIQIFTQQNHQYLRKSQIIGQQKQNQQFFKKYQMEILQKDQFIQILESKIEQKVLVIKQKQIQILSLIQQVNELMEQKQNNIKIEQRNLEIIMKVNNIQQNNENKILAKQKSNQVNKYVYAEQIKGSNLSNQSLQYSWLCPITKMLMKNPVMTADGHTYQEQAIVKWLQNKQTSPNTGLPLNTKQIIPNILMKKFINKLFEKFIRINQQKDQIIKNKQIQFQQKVTIIQKKSIQIKRIKKQAYKILINYDTDEVNKLIDRRQIQKAFELANKAVQKKVVLAYSDLARIYLDENKTNIIKKNGNKAYQLATQGFKHQQPNSYNILAECYYYGYVVEKDSNKAFEWYNKSAERGNSYGQNNLAAFYLNNYGVDQDYEKAVEWFTKSAEQGNSQGQNNLGLCYLNGDGVENDSKKAVEWFTKSAEQGNSNGQNSLGSCYLYGYGVEKDYKKSFEWYTKSADQGDSDSQNSLGVCYQNGYGVEKDYKKAVEWYTKSAKQGNQLAQDKLKQLKYYVK